MLEIRPDGGVLAYAPGVPVRGTLAWTFESAPRELTLELLWYTEGRGDRDVGVARTLTVEAPAAIGSQAFDFAGPGGPYSCSGRLVSIRWTLEAVATPSRDRERVELVIAPNAREVALFGNATEAPA